ncbi:hypothetical protein MY8738_010169 [Beauveria namnaoensis]
MGDTRCPHDAEDGVQKRSTKNNDIPAPVTSNVNVGLSAVAALAMLGLVFGGCCSNVYALESIINFESGSVKA